MKAITTTGKIDPSGQLSLDHPIEGTAPKSVRVIILFEEIDLPATKNLMSAECGRKALVGWANGHDY